MALKPLKYSLKHVAMALLLHNVAAGVGTALPLWAVPQTSAIVSVFRVVMGESFGEYSEA